MQRKLAATTVFWCLLISILWATSETRGQAFGFQRDSYAGNWTGSYTAADGSKGSLAYSLSKDTKGQWRGTVKFTNQGGEQSAELRSIRIASGKFNAKLDTPDGKNEVALEGTFQGNRFAGTYVVSSKDGSGNADNGSWTTTKTPSAKGR